MDTELLSGTFVELADTMVADFDIIDFLYLLTERSVQLLSASAAGVVLAAPDGELQVAAASSDLAELVELFQIQKDRGPAWTASVPAGPSPRLTCEGRASPGRSSPRRDRRRVPVGPGGPDAAARRSHRRAEPVR